MRVLTGHDDVVRCLAYSPDGSVLAAGDEGNSIRLWSLPAGEEVCVLDRDAGSVEAVAFSPGGDKLAAGLPEHIIVWDVDSQLLAGNRQQSSEQPGHEGGTRGLAWHPQGQLVSCGWDREVCFWTPELAQRWQPLGVYEPMMALGFTPGGKELALAGNNGTFLLVDMATRKRPHQATRKPLERKHARGLFSLACAPDGQLIATGDARGDIVLWDLTSPAPTRILQGHQWTVYGLGFTPNGRILVSGSADKTVRLWEVSSGRLVETFRFNEKSGSERCWVTSVAVAPDGMTASAGSADGTIVVFDLADV